MTVSTTTRSPSPATEARARTAPSTHVALAAIGLGLAATVLAMGAVAYDVTTADVLADHLHDTYAPHGVTPPGEGLVAAYLFTVGGLGILGWAAAAWAVARRKRWARPASTVLLALGALVALAHLTVGEYGSPILPTPVGLAGVAICVPGLLAVVQLWRSRVPGEHRVWSGRSEGPSTR